MRSRWSRATAVSKSATDRDGVRSTLKATTRNCTRGVPRGVPAFSWDIFAKSSCSLGPYAELDARWLRMEHRHRDK